MAKKPVNTTTVPHLKLDLLANGIDFIQAGIEQFFLKDRPRPRAHKYAILHIFSGVLLLLKERLRRAHPAFIYSNIHDALKDDAKTVDFTEAITRLNTVAGCRISDSDERLLRRAQKVRNRLEHYQVELNLHEAKALVGALAEFVYLFMKKELAKNLEAHVSTPVWERLQQLRAIAKAIADAKQQAWLKRIEKYERMTDEQLTARRQQVEGYHPKHNPEPERVFDCPECGEASVVMVERGLAICTNPACRGVMEVSECMRCYDAILGEEDFCEACQDYIDAQ